jgi:hypothetical protein
MADIKTRDAVKGTIKTIDKAAIASERMKSAYVEIKERAEQGYYADENSATEYAADRISYAADRVKDEGIHQFNKQGQKAVKTTQENIGKAKDKISDFKQSRAVKAAEQKAIQNMSEQHGLQIRHGVASRSTASDVSQTAKSQLIKTRQQGRKMIKTTARNAEKAVKSTAKGTVKTTEKGIKTAQATSKAAIKTTETSVKTAQAVAKASAKTAQKAAQAAKATAKATAEATKATVRATIAAVKAIIAGTKADFRFNCRWLDCSCDYSHCCPARLCCFPVWWRKREQRLYACQCGGGSLHAADTEVCEAVRHPRICGAYQGGDDAGKRRAWA